MDNIIRTYPNKLQYELLYKYVLNNIEYDKYDFNRIKLCFQDIDINKYISGINPHTGRKIKLDGKIHNKIFWNKYNIFYNKFNKFKNISEVDEFINSIDIKNNIIKINNDNIRLINKHIDNIINKINSIIDWNDYIEYNNIKYGISIIYNNIHHYNNCNGTMINYDTINHECKGCCDGVAFNGGYNCGCYTIKKYKCNNCDYLNEI